MSCIMHVTLPIKCQQHYSSCCNDEFTFRRDAMPSTTHARITPSMLFFFQTSFFQSYCTVF